MKHTLTFENFINESQNEGTHFIATVQNIDDTEKIAEKLEVLGCVINNIFSFGVIAGTSSDSLEDLKNLKIEGILNIEHDRTSYTQLTENLDETMLKEIALKMGKAYSCVFNISKNASTSNAKLTYVPWLIKLVSAGNGWSLGKYFNKKDADEVAKWINSNEATCIAGTASAIVEKDDFNAYLYVEDIENLIKAAGIKI